MCHYLTSPVFVADSQSWRIRWNETIASVIPIDRYDWWNFIFKAFDGYLILFVWMGNVEMMIQSKSLELSDSQCNFHSNRKCVHHHWPYQTAIVGYRVTTRKSCLIFSLNFHFILKWRTSTWVSFVFLRSFAHILVPSTDPTIIAPGVFARYNE